MLLLFLSCDKDCLVVIDLFSCIVFLVKLYVAHRVGTRGGVLSGALVDVVV